MARLVPVVFALLVSGLAACDVFVHEPTGENVVEVDPAVEPLVIRLDEVPGTVALWGDVTFAPEFASTESRPIRRVEVYLGDRLVASSESAGPISVSTGSVPDGTYALRIVAYAPNGRGSLGDRVGAVSSEVIGEVTRTAIVDNTSVPPQRSIEYGILDGALTAQWEAYDHPTFQSYRVYAVPRFGARQLVAEITDPEESFWVDADYLGGERSYAVEVRARGLVSAGPVAGVDYAFPTMVSATQVGEHRVRLVWTSTPFTAALGSYQIDIESATRPGQQSEIVSIAAAADTVLVHENDGRFLGDLYTYGLNVVDMGGSRVARTVASTKTGVSAPTQQVLGYTAGGWIGFDSGDLVRLTGAEFSVSERRRILSPPDVYTSPNGRVGVITSQAVEYLDGQSLAVLSRAVRPSALQASIRPDVNPGRGRINDAGVLVVGYSEYYSPTTYVNLGVLALDLSAGTIAGRLDAPGDRPPGFRINYIPISMLAASPDGRYAVIRKGSSSGPTVLVAIDEQGQFSEQSATASALARFGAMVFVGSGRLAATEGRQIHILSVPSLEPVAQFPALVTGGIHDLLSYDPGSGLLMSTLAIAGGNAFLQHGYDPATGEQVFDAQTATHAPLHGGVLWVGNRYRRVAAAL